MTVDSGTIARYLDQLGWTYKIHDDRRVLSRFRLPIQFYYYPVALEIVIGEHWVVLRTLLQRDVQSGQVDAVLRYISQWNERVHLVRFILTQGSVLLQGEIPSGKFHMDTFVDVLTASYKYCQLAGVEIATLSTNPSIAALFNSVYASLTRPTGNEFSEEQDFDLHLDMSVNVLPLASQRQPTIIDNEVSDGVQRVVSSEVG